MLMPYEIVETSGDTSDIESTTPAIIKVIGAGGGGSNAVNRMVASGMRYVDFIAVNTDKQALKNSNAPIKIAIGSKLTGGLGAGGDPAIGEKAALEDKEAITEAIKDANMLFITAGMGGGTGTGSAPVIAEIAKSLGILTVAVVTKPFNFEGRPRFEIAEKGIEKLRSVVDSIIVIPNQNLYKISALCKTFLEGFAVVDDVLRQAIQGISDLVYQKGIVNVDFADVKSVMVAKGNAHMGIGNGRGEKRVADVIDGVLNNPILENSDIDGATHILVIITSDGSVKMDEVEEIMNAIRGKADQNAAIFFGVTVDTACEDSLIVTLIATGFPSTDFYKYGKVGDVCDDGDNTEDSRDDSMLTTKQWDKLKDGKPPAISGLTTRNNRMKSFKNEVVTDTCESKYSCSFNLPSSDEDLELPTYYRNKKEI